MCRILTYFVKIVLVSPFDFELSVLSGGGQATVFG
jgi:hypothetical protein